MQEGKIVAANIKHIAWWWSPLGNQCNGLLLLGMHCIKLVFESVKQILCRSMFHCEQALYLLLLELLEVVSICLHWKLMVTSAKMIVVEQLDSVRSQSATNNCSWEPFWIELGEFLCCNWEYIFQILCKKVKVTWLPENWGTLWIFYSYFIYSWKLNKCFHYDILPLTARYIYNSNQFMNISKFPPSPNKIPRCILSKPTEHGVCYQFYDWSL